MSRRNRIAIVASVVLLIFWGCPLYFLTKTYPDEWQLLLFIGLVLFPFIMLYMWFEIIAREKVIDYVESIRNERTRDFLESLADLPFRCYILAALIWAVLILVLKAISMF